MKVKTLKSLIEEVEEAEGMVDTWHEGSDYSLMEAKTRLRKAKEELRIFKYKAHQCLTPNGRLLRR